jgi:hypothetical protein
VSPVTRLRAGVLAVLVLAIGTLFGAPAGAARVQTAAPGDGLCSVEEWQALSFDECVKRLPDVTDPLECLVAPTPATPDSGFAGWFASVPTWNYKEGIEYGRYSSYGYGGYDYTTYAIGNCVQTAMHPDYKFETTIANGEFMLATGVIAGSNALRERSWDPGALWSWADPLVEKATRAIYEKVFSVFGVVTLAVVGLYLIWRSRRAELSGAMTTAGWAVFVMIAVTAVAQWPVHSANVADSALTTTLGVVHDAVGPSSPIPVQCVGHEAEPQCADNRPPAVRAGDTAVDTLLYRNWLRGQLGSADSDTAKKYGPVLYDAKTLSWLETQKIDSVHDDAARKALRDSIIKRKQSNWKRVAQQISLEDPEAYQYLQGTKGMERIGAGFVAILSALSFALFDIVASLLVLLGFLIFRWAVIATPALGTVAILRPASAGLRRLAGAVLAAVFNIAIFGTGAAVYLSAVDLIMNTASLPGWLQVTLILLCGVVGWILLRPYRRITQLGGAPATQGWGKALLRPAAAAATAAVAPPAVAAAVASAGRPEGRKEGGSEVAAGDTPPMRVEVATRSEGVPEQRRWRTVDLPESAPDQVVYRPTSDPAPEVTPTRPATRVEAR